jgi:hypothetical protein
MVLRKIVVTSGRLGALWYPLGTPALQLREMEERLHTFLEKVLR